jgi:hypothetical protein
MSISLPQKLRRTLLSPCFGHSAHFYLFTPDTHHTLPSLTSDIFISDTRTILNIQHTSLPYLWNTTHFSLLAPYCTSDTSFSLLLTMSKFLSLYLTHSAGYPLLSAFLCTHHTSISLLLTLSPLLDTQHFTSDTGHISIFLLLTLSIFLLLILSTFLSP